MRFEDVVAGYGKKTILHGPSFGVPRGAITTVIGPNGAGKSTAFKAASACCRCAAGRILFDGEDITNLAPRQLIAGGIGYVPQGRNIFPELSVRHNLELGGVAAPKGFDLAAAHGGGDGPLPGAAPQGRASRPPRSPAASRRCSRSRAG